MDESRLISVRTELVLEQIVGAILDEGTKGASDIRQRDVGAHLDEAEAMLDAAGRAAATIAPGIAEKLAHHGYASRNAEKEMFEAARLPAQWLEALMAERRGGPSADHLQLAASTAAEMAAAEPDHRPDPGEGSASWRIPGPGGHVRHYVAIRCPVALGLDSGRNRPTVEAAGDIKRCWHYGFYLRCCEDAV